MYKKWLQICLLLQTIWMVAFLCVRTSQVGEIMAGMTGESEVSDKADAADADEPCLEQLVKEHNGLEEISSGQRVVEVELLENPLGEEAVSEALSTWGMCDEDYEILLRIVEAEAGTEDEEGKMLVAGVVLNRVANPAFPNTVREVVFQNTMGISQFTPASNGRIYEVNVTDSTRAAVLKVLNGEDITQGALYFASRRYAGSERMAWFDNNLTFLFSHGGHEFFN